MNKEILDTLDNLSKRPTTELAMRLMETTVDNMAKNKELERLNKQYDFMEQSLDDKQKVIDKAIEYIEEYWKKNSYYADIDNCLQFCDFEKEDLLNILHGSDEQC